MFEPIVNPKGSPNIDAQASELTVAGRLEQMRREVVRSRELVAELRRQIEAKNGEIQRLEAQVAATRDHSSKHMPSLPGLKKVRSSSPFGRLRMSLSWIAHRASLRISRGASAR